MEAASSTVAVLITLIIAVAGCQVGGPNWVGEWQGRVPFEKTEGFSEDIQNTLGRVNITIRENGTFSMVLHGLPFEGEWSAGRSELTLTPNRVLDRPVAQLGDNMRLLAKPYLLQEKAGKIVSPSFAVDPIVLTKTSENARSQ